MRSRKRGCAAGACRCQSALSQLGKPVGEQISTALQAAMKDLCNAHIADWESDDDVFASMENLGKRACAQVPVQWLKVYHQASAAIDGST